MHKGFSTAALLAVAAAAAAAAVPAYADPSTGPVPGRASLDRLSEACDRPGTVIELDALPAAGQLPSCRLDVTLAKGAARVALPARGTAVTNESLTLDGRGDSLRVAVDALGRVTASDPVAAPDQDSDDFAAAAVDRCSDGTYVLKSAYYSVHPYTYSVNATTAPSGVSQTDWITAVRSASETWYLQRNSCAFPRKTTNGPGNGYKGTTTGRAGQSSANQCASDLSSVVSGQDLPAGTLASACSFEFQGTGYIETDIALNRVDHAWSTGACPSGRFDVWTVMVHEFGHGMGLAHTSAIENDADHDLVMSPGIISCEIKRALGKGDYDGYLKRYYTV